MSPPLGAARGGAVVGRPSYESAIPDSVVYQFLVGNIGVSDGTSGFTWPESEQSDDMAVTGATYDTSLFGGDGGVRSDGTDDTGTTSTMGAFGSNLDGQWALAIGISTTDDSSGVLGTSNGGDDLRFWVGTSNYASASSGPLTVYMRGAGGTTVTASTTTDITDGSDYVWLINKEGAGASNIKFYSDATTSENSPDDNNSLGSASNFDNPMRYFGVYNDFAGSVQDRIDADHSHFLWFDDSLNESDRQWVFDQYGWYSP